MKKADFQVYKERLIALRARVRGDVHALAESALSRTRSESNGDLSSMPIHMADIGSDNFEQEFTLSLIQSDDDILEQIEAALERLEDSSYGICVACGSKIPKARLNAIPYTPNCVRCASELEG